MKRMILLATVGAMLAAMMSIPGAALADADVCVGNKGETKVDKGDSTCSSDETSHAVARNGSSATATDDSRAMASDSSAAIATSNCTAKADNGEIAVCPAPS